jgi:hypothetical protein
MTNSELPRPSQDRERQNIAELLGRILAAFWLDRRRPATDPQAERTGSPRENRD